MIVQFNPAFTDLKIPPPSTVQYILLGVTGSIKILLISPFPVSENKFQVAPPSVDLNKLPLEEPQ